jgi:hypothetical protein
MREQSPRPGVRDSSFALGTSREDPVLEQRDVARKQNPPFAYRNRDQCPIIKIRRIPSVESQLS